MRKVLAGLTAAGLVGVVLPLAAAEATITGELISAMCYAEDASQHGDSHKACSIECVSKGEPVALLTADGTVYRVTGALAADQNAKLIPHVSHQVALTGEVSEANGQKQIAATAIAMAK